MKKIITFSLFAFSLFFAGQALAQEKDDLLEVLEIVFDMDEVQDLYQHEITGGRTLILEKPNSRALGRGPNSQIQNMLYDLRNEDVQYFNYPIKIMTPPEAEALDISSRLLTQMSLQMSPTEIRIILRGYLWESRSSYQGMFSFIRETEDDDWELNSKNFEKRRSD